MRIIAGKYKGHRLVEFKGEHLRPTTDRVKESVFNKWQFQIPGAQVLDLFSGTGNLGLEALSRGAEHVLSVESHRRSLAIMAENRAKLKVGQEWEIHSHDVFSFLKAHAGPGFDLILCDPPFTEQIADQVMQAIAASQCHKPGTLLMIESAGKEKIADQYPPFLLLDRRDFGDKKVSFYQVQQTD